MTKHTHSTSFEIAFGGHDTHELGVFVRFNYTASTGDYYDKSMGYYYPGDGEEIEITSIHLFETPEPNAKELECPRPRSAATICGKPPAKTADTVLTSGRMHAALMPNSTVKAQL